MPFGQPLQLLQLDQSLEPAAKRQKLETGSLVAGLETLYTYMDSFWKSSI